MNDKADDKKEVETIQIVTFKIQDEYYGVEVASIHEIIGMTDITILPNRLNFMMGVINLRGVVVPVIDLRIKFNFSKKEYDRQTVILVGEINDNIIGVIVDSVSDVISITEDNIQVQRSFSSSIKNDYIEGIIRIDEKLIILLEIDKILSDEELDQINS